MVYSCTCIDLFVYMFVGKKSKLWITYALTVGIVNLSVNIKQCSPFFCILLCTSVLIFLYLKEHLFQMDYIINLFYWISVFTPFFAQFNQNLVCLHPWSGLFGQVQIQ